MLNYPASLLDSLTKPNRITPWLFRVTLTLPTIPVSPIYYFADFDTDVVANIPTAPGAATTSQATFYSFGVKRNSIKRNAALKVDEMSVGVPNAMVQFQNVQTTIGFLARSGILDLALVDIFVWDGENPTQTCGWHSSWLIENATVSLTTVTLALTSRMAQLKRQGPRTVYQSQCNNMIFDASCGLIKANYTSSYAALASSTTTQLQFTISGTDVNGRQKGASGYYTLGQIVGTSGLNNGVARSVMVHVQNGATGTLTLLQALPWQPNVNDTFNVVPGCAGDINSCVNYNNLRGQGNPAMGGFRGFPDIAAMEKSYG